MIRKSLSSILFALSFLAVTDLAVTWTGAPLSGFAGPVAAQDDDDDDDDDDDGGGGGGTGRANASDDDGSTAEPQRRGSSTRARNARPAAQVAPLPAQAEGEIVVTGLTATDLALLLDAGFTVIETSALLRNGPVLHRLRVPEGTTLDVARDRVRALESGRNADFNHYYRSGQSISPAGAPAASVATPAPAGCTHLNCGFLDQIGWPVDRPAGCRATVEIGVIDTSVNLDHAGLTAAQVELVRVADADMPTSGETHGTAVVALLAGAEARAPGLLPEVRIVAVDVFSLEGGDERADVAHLVQALDLLAARGVRVANLSLAGPENAVLTDMLAAVAGGGMLVVAAAGNAGPAAPPAWPAAAETVLAVTAVDAQDRIYRRAQRGAHLDLAAPGVEVWSAASIRGVKPRSGTSFAAPFATAAAALLMSRDPAMTPAMVMDALRRLTRDLGAEGADEVFGHGIMALGRICDGSVE